MHYGRVDDATFQALADPTRRLLLSRLRETEGLSINELSADLPMSRQAVTKHLDLLQAAGLVRFRRVGRRRLHELEPIPLKSVQDWLAPYAQAWDERLTSLRRHLDEEELSEGPG